MEGNYALWFAECTSRTNAIYKRTNKATSRKLAKRRIVEIGILEGGGPALRQMRIDKRTQQKTDAAPKTYCTGMYSNPGNNAERNTGGSRQIRMMYETARRP